MSRLLFFLAFFFAGALEAREYHFGSVTNEALNQCDSLYWTGRSEEARTCYEELTTSGQTLAVIAEAYWALGDMHSANRYFNQAVEAEPDNSFLLTRWADLYVETHQPDSAAQMYADAAMMDAENAYAGLGAALVFMAGGDPHAGDHLELLATRASFPNGARVRALFSLIEMSLLINELEQAESLLNDVEEMSGEHPASEAQYQALLAALAVRKKTDPMEWVNASLAINPNYGDAYAIPAYFYVITFQYDEAAAFYQKAVDTQPDHWHAHLELGASHLRQNRPTAARIHFELSYEGDAFNPEAVNYLRLMDTYEELEVLNYPDSSQNLLPVFSLRLDPSEVDLLAPYVSKITQEAIDVFTERYGFELRETATIELYPNHDDFIVRALGMPGAGLLGVAFGYLVAMDSPSAKEGSDYHWGTTLWHEVAHIYTLGISRHQVPRWYSEGISVFEEWQTGPIPGTRIPLSVYQSLIEYDLLPVDQLDRGFTRPEYDNQVIVSYMQSGLICEYIYHDYGFAALVDILNAFRDGMDTVQALESVLDIDTLDFDNNFAQYFFDTYGHFLGDLSDWMEKVEAASRSARQSDWEQAIVYADEALAVYSADTSSRSPWLIKALAQGEMGDISARMQTLEAYWKQGGYQPDPLMDLAEYFIDEGRKPEARQILQGLNLVTPFELEVHNLLGELLMEEQEYAQALVEFRVAMALDPLDKAAAHYRLASAYHGLGQSIETQDHLMAALEIAPHYRPAQTLLLETIK